MSESWNFWTSLLVMSLVLKERGVEMPLPAFELLFPIEPLPVLEVAYSRTLI